MTMMPVSGSTDAFRLAALRAGDERAFAELVDEFSPRMLRLAHVYLCNALGVTDTNQRVLLHRARTKVRAALEAAFDTTETPA
jgi:DNA-directed RNA polymerase specialized sigma24 family protein